MRVVGGCWSGALSVVPGQVEVMVVISTKQMKTTPASYVPLVSPPDRSPPLARPLYEGRTNRGTELRCCPTEAKGERLQARNFHNGRPPSFRPFPPNLISSKASGVREGWWEWLVVVGVVLCRWSPGWWR